MLSLVASSLQEGRLLQKNGRLDKRHLHRGGGDTQRAGLGRHHSRNDVRLVQHGANGVGVPHHANRCGVPGLPRDDPPRVLGAFPDADLRCEHRSTSLPLPDQSGEESRRAHRPVRGKADDDAQLPEGRGQVRHPPRGRHRDLRRQRRVGLGHGLVAAGDRREGESLQRWELRAEVLDPFSFEVCEGERHEHAELEEDSAEGGGVGDYGRAGHHGHELASCRGRVCPTGDAELDWLHPLRRRAPGLHDPEPDLGEVRGRLFVEALGGDVPARRPRPLLQPQPQVLLDVLLDVGLRQHGPEQLLVLQFLPRRARAPPHLSREAGVRHPVGRMGRGGHGRDHGRHHAPASDDGPHAVLHREAGPQRLGGRLTHRPSGLQRLHRQPRRVLRDGRRRCRRHCPLQPELEQRVGAHSTAEHLRLGPVVQHLQDVSVPRVAVHEHGPAGLAEAHPAKGRAGR
mmetsp:Transcript_64004/g.179075  ORF Transcript_64004/g.179075 Transcript_64004/m.179075 type:complete len:456 (-) Transcript_64004:202-1569(-)